MIDLPVSVFGGELHGGCRPGRARHGASGGQLICPDRYALARCVPDEEASQGGQRALPDKLTWPLTWG